MSLAHGWSTGPTSALTFDVLGTAPEPGDRRSTGSSRTPAT
jgi:hypothetical protein